MDKNIFEFDGEINVGLETEAAQISDLTQLSDLHLAMVGGGIGNTVL